MIHNVLAPLELGFFDSLNRLVEPLVRIGLGAPALLPVGLVVVETRGRKTGRRISVPLVAMTAGDLVVVSTVRSRSSWLRNLAAHGAVSFWLGGRERNADAFVIGRGTSTPNKPPEKIGCLARSLKQHSALFGTGFAILIPRES